MLERQEKPINTGDKDTKWTPNLLTTVTSLSLRYAAGMGGCRAGALLKLMVPVFDGLCPDSRFVSIIRKVHLDFCWQISTKIHQNAMY